MGWSHTQAAGRAMDRIEAACKLSRELTGETSNNVFVSGGKRYFYEVTRRDQEDGGIAGTINLSWDGWARKVGTFRIDGQGMVVRGPQLFKLAQPQPAGRWS